MDEFSFDSFEIHETYWILLSVTKNAEESPLRNDCIKLMQRLKADNVGSIASLTLAELAVVKSALEKFQPTDSTDAVYKYEVEYFVKEYPK